MDYQVQEEKSPVKMDELTAVYISIRDMREEIKRSYEANDAELKQQLEVIEQEMLNVCKELGADNIKTPAGTIIRSVKSRYWTNDWDSMYTFIKEAGAFGLLEKRLHQTNMKEFLFENPDIYPKGLNVESQYTVVVRRAK
jgi:hypothetical protein